MPKLYSEEQLLNDQIKRVIVYDREEEDELDEDSRSKLSNVEYNKPFDYSKLPPIYETFVPQNDKTSQPWKFIHSNESFLNVGPVKPVAQVNGPLPSSEKLLPLPKRCLVLKYFDTFMEDIQLLEKAIEQNSEIKGTTFISITEKAKR